MRNIEDYAVAFFAIVGACSGALTILGLVTFLWLIAICGPHSYDMPVMFSNAVARVIVFSAPTFFTSLLVGLPIAGLRGWV
jgi:hypothetical protein